MSVLEKPAQFALAGNAVFTLVSLKTQTRFTFKVRAAEQGPMHFVSVLTGPDNTSDFAYFGFLRRGVFFHGGQKARVGKDAPSVKAFDWFWRHMAQGDDVSTLVEVHHEGRCGRCGRALTVPESIKSGFGPECIGKVF
jgi:Family of unknown function (DUF6011)